MTLDDSGAGPRIFHALPWGGLLLDGEGVVRAVNSAALTLLAVEESSLVGKPLLDALPSWKDTPVAEALPALLEQAHASPVEFEFSTSSEQWLRVKCASVGNSAGPMSWLVTLDDVTESARLKQRLRRTEYQASIGKLARGIAHELNNPLDGVLRYTHLALEHLNEDAPVREYLVHVKEGLDRMVRAVRAFLEFSRQAMTPVNRVANLNQLIDDALLLVHHRAKFQHIHIIKQFDEQLPSVLDGGIQHAIVNLVKNAFDAMPRGGTLTIQTRKSDTSVEVEIDDTGSGIPEAIRDRIFEPFFSTKPIHQGCGLGLVIAKEVVERSGGIIQFTSRVGIGTSFQIQIPIVSQELQELSENGA